MSRIHRWLLPLAAALALAAPVSAQWKPSADARQLATFSLAAATTPATDAGGRLETSPHETPARAITAPALPGVRRTSRDVALMIVGGAAVILGSVIGDDGGTMLMVGGSVVGLVGLYQYLT